MTKLRKTCWLLASLCCIPLALDCVRLAYAERLASENTPEAIRQAIDVWPWRADYHRYLAVLEPDTAAPAFARALELNPRDTRSWVRMGLEAENQGKMDEAERCLVHAASIDRSYEPRWNLSNYYFRRGDGESAWKWAHEASLVGGDDMTPLFDIGWRVRPNSEAMLRDIVPADCISRRRFFDYLRSNEASSQALAVANRLISCTDQQTRADLTQFTNSQVFAGKATEALTIWNQMVGPNDLPFRALDPARGRILTNGEFTAFPSRLGFDWHFDPTKGLAISKAADGGLRLQFDGYEPDAFAVLYQPLPAQPHTSYQLECDLRSSETEVPEGFRWRLADLRTGAAIVPDGADMRGPAGTRTWQFQSSNTPVHVLALVYQRPQGATRFRGELNLRQVKVDPARGGN